MIPGWLAVVIEVLVAQLGLLFKSVNKTLSYWYTTFERDKKNNYVPQICCRPIMNCLVAIADIKENGFHRPDHKSTPRPFLDPISGK